MNEHLKRMVTLVIWGVIAVGGGLIAWQLVVPATAESEPIYVTPLASVAQIERVTPTNSTVLPTIYISGAVINPGVYVFDSGLDIRIVDVVVRAGGLRADADAASINLAAPIADATHVHVPSRIELQSQSLASDRTTAPATNLVNLNTATVEVLSELPGVGPALAQRIIDFREQNGPFTTLDDLDAVSGVGPALLSKIEQYVSFDS